VHASGGARYLDEEPDAFGRSVRYLDEEPDTFGWSVRYLDEGTVLF